MRQGSGAGTHPHSALLPEESKQPQAGECGPFHPETERKQAEPGEEKALEGRGGREAGGQGGREAGTERGLT